MNASGLLLRNPAEAEETITMRKATYVWFWLLAWTSVPGALPAQPPSEWRPDSPGRNAQRPYAAGDYSSPSALAPSPVLDETEAAGSPCLESGGGRQRLWSDRLKPRLQWGHWGYADEFQKCPPFGSLLRAHMSAQRTNAQAAQLVLYRYDFCDEKSPNAARLNAHGEKRLKALVSIVQSSGLYPLVIERTPGNPRLDAARRAEILRSVVAGASFAFPEDWVVVGEPAVPGMRGDEAYEIHKGMGKLVEEPFKWSREERSARGSR